MFHIDRIFSRKSSGDEAFAVIAIHRPKTFISFSRIKTLLLFALYVEFFIIFRQNHIHHLRPVFSQEIFQDSIFYTFVYGRIHRSNKLQSLFQPLWAS